MKRSDVDENARVGVAMVVTIVLVVAAVHVLACLLAARVLR